MAKKKTTIPKIMRTVFWFTPAAAMFFWRKENTHTALLMKQIAN